MSEVSQASLSDPWKMFGSEMAYKKWRRGILGGRKIQRFSGRREYNSSAAAKSLQLCPTLCDPIDGSPPGSPVPGILQARTLEWVAISFSNAWKWKVKVKSLSRVQLFATPQTAAHQAPRSMGFSRQEYWSGVPSPSQPNKATYRKIHQPKNWYDSKFRFQNTTHSYEKFLWRRLTSY